MSRTLAAIEPDMLRNLALGVSVGSLVVAVVLMKVVSTIVGKAVSAVLLVAVALVGYSQREQISDCIDTVTEQANGAVPSVITCEFFGQEISVKVPLASK